MQAGIISLKQQSKGLIPVKVPSGEDKPQSQLGDKAIETFEEQLVAVLSNIFDRKVPFQKTSDPDRWIYCPYQEICNR